MNGGSEQESVRVSLIRRRNMKPRESLKPSCEHCQYIGTSFSKISKQENYVAVDWYWHNNYKQGFDKEIYGFWISTSNGFKEERVVFIGDLNIENNTSWFKDVKRIWEMYNTPRKCIFD